MNKLSSLSLLGLLLTLLSLTLPASAQTIRRVNNTGISGTNIYADLPAAYAAAAAGDIIQVEPSGTQYSGIVLDKNVTIVGPGYFLDPSQNAGLQANPLPATVGSIELRAGGASAYVAGLTVSAFYVEASNVTVQRCNISALYMNYANAPLTNVVVKQNYISYLAYAYSTPVDNALITNNIIGSVSFPINYNGGFFNNVVLSSATISNFFITNNYFASLSGAGNTFNNNINASAFSANFPNTNGNQASVPPSSVFVLAPGATAFDAWYQLKAGTNPARGTGQGGADVGAFGGTTPYKLGGLPAIPSIYQQTQTISGNSLNVTLSTRSNN